MRGHFKIDRKGRLILANSPNTTWIVSCVIWKNSKGGLPNVTHCNSRSFRREDYARERFDSIIDSLIEDGFDIEKLEVPERESYEGIRACRKSVVHAVVYIDRNPVWKS